MHAQFMRIDAQETPNGTCLDVWPSVEPQNIDGQGNAAKRSRRSARLAASRISGDKPNTASTVPTKDE